MGYTPGLPTIGHQRKTRKLLPQNTYIETCKVTSSKNL